MSDKEVLQAYLDGVSSGKKVVEVARECGTTEEKLQSKLHGWRKKGVKIPSVSELKRQNLGQLKKAVGEFFAK